MDAMNARETISVITVFGGKAPLPWGVRLLAFILAVWMVVFSGMLFAAEEKKYPGLADGLEAMGAFQGVHPKADDAYQKLVDRAPANVRASVQASDWAEQQRNLTAEQLDAAVEDPNMRVIPTADGLAVIPASKVKNGINALTDFAIDQEETAEFVRTARDRIPADRFGTPEAYEDFRSKAGTVAEHLDAMRQSGDGLYATGKRIAIKAIVSVAATAQIDQLSGDIKNRIINEGAAKVLDDYRRAADERKRKIAEQVEKAKAAEAERKRREAGEAAKTKEREENRSADTGKRGSKASWLQRAEEQFGIVESYLGVLDNGANECNAAMDAMPDLRNAEPEGLFLGDTSELVAAERELAEAERLISGADALKTFIEQARTAADSACSTDASGGASEVSVEERTRELEKTGAVARGVYEALKSQLDSMIAMISAPLDLGRLAARIAKLDTYKSACTSNQAAAKQTLETIKNLKWNEMREELDWGKAYVNEAKKHASKPIDMDILAYETRAAALEERELAIVRKALPCRQKAWAYGKCQDVLKGDKSGEVEKAKQRAEALADKRAKMATRLSDLLGRIEKDYSATKKAVERGKGCVSGPGQQETACDPKGIEDAFSAANADYFKENFAAAKAALQAIQAQYGGCSGVSDRVDKGHNTIDTVANAKTKTDAAIADCDVPKMESYIAQMEALSSPHPSMASWIARMRARLPECKGTQVANADADCRGRDGPGYKASVQADGSYYCVPDKSAADNWCQTNHGAGWYAGSVSGTGTFDCHPGSQARTNECKKRHGSAARAGKLRSDGSYACYTPRSPTTRPTARKPKAGPTTGEVIGGIIAEVIKSQTSKKKKPGKRTPGRKCHRRPDGTIHCGSG